MKIDLQTPDYPSCKKCWVPEETSQILSRAQGEVETVALDKVDHKSGYPKEKLGLLSIRAVIDCRRCFDGTDNVVPHITTTIEVGRLRSFGRKPEKIADVISNVDFDGPISCPAIRHDKQSAHR